MPNPFRKILPAYVFNVMANTLRKVRDSMPTSVMECYLHVEEAMGLEYILERAFGVDVGQFLGEAVLLRTRHFSRSLKVGEDVARG